MSTNQQGTQSPSGQRLQSFAMKVHVSFYRLTGGAIGGKLAGRPMLLLTTLGRKSGLERITPILYFSDGNRYILIASNGGAPKHPQWFLNLLAQPEAKAQIKQDILNVIATQADPEERQRLWSLVTAKYQNFADYQKKTTREIPVVILTPQAKEEK
jgi:F420H(2)-dependent quinone reductase